MNWIYVFVGGGAGSLLRYGFSTLFSRLVVSTFPYATFCANIISCLIFSLILGLSQKMDGTFMEEKIKMLLITGFCGGLSTFSTFSFENAELLKRGCYGWMSLNVLSSLILCILIFFIFAPAKSQT